MDISLLIQLTCRCCSLVFYLCRRCYRGQVYCCAACRKQTQHKSHNASQKRYRRTEKGREAHRQAERRRRLGKTETVKKTMDDEGTTPTPIHDILLTIALNSTPMCCSCGCSGTVVTHFPRRSYG